MATAKKTATKKSTPVKKVVVKETVVKKPVKVESKVVEKPVEVKVAPVAVAHVEIKGEKVMRDIGVEVREVVDALKVLKAEPVNATAFDSFVIKEVMHQKGVTWEEAIEILQNPS